ncbi:pentatricopeptide repeat-containing protein At3g61520, mitochondrial [Quercus lobata]|uniref:Pentatricopeptide repeat-containing protein n=1 Tax=Quercus lobata TaxID=97700 RepID=A0A7N2LGC9_QUELO|nr:pentatricopeptide repeat-containing protein At3g61520, mitochondrial [Quercus lobata]
MAISISASKLFKLRLHSPIILRHLSTESNPPPPPPHQDQDQDQDSLITQALQLLQAPDYDSNSNTTTPLQELLFSSSSPSSPFIFRNITRRLSSSSEALKFFHYLQSNSTSQDILPSLSSTFQAIFELASREPDSHNKLLELYGTAKEHNVPLTINAATLLIRCLGRAGMVDQVLVVVKEVDPSLKNTHFCNVVIDVMFRLGRVDDALKVLDEMLQPDSECPPNDSTGDIIFGAMLRREWRGRSINDEEIVGLVSKFGEHDVFPDTFQLTQLITKFCRNRKTGRAWDLLHDVMKSGGVVEAASCNALLTGLGKGGDFERMNNLTTEMKEMNIQPNVVTFGILINLMCKSRRVDDALEVFKKMKEGSDGVLVEPDAIMYNTLIDGLCKVGRQEEGLSLVEQMRSQNGCAPNTVTYNCLIDGFCKSGEIERAQELFDQMNRESVFPNVITLNTLIDGMCRHGRINSAVEFLNDMQSKGVKGNAVTYAILINAFCNVNNIDKAMEFFDQMSNSGCSPDAIVYYTLISGLSQAGRMDDASSVVSKLKEVGFCLDTVCYNVLIGGFCKKNKLDKAYETLKEMEEAGVKPDSVTYNTLISYLSKTGNFTTAHRVMRKMIKEGLKPTVVTYGALIHAYCLIGKIDEGMKIFRDMGSASKVPPNTVIYNILIDSLCKNDDVEHALSLMDDMKVKGVKPNITTYNAIFKGLRDKNLLEKAFELMDRMIEQACNPDYITMEVLTEWLSAVGETGKLKKFVQGYEVSASSA